MTIEPTHETLESLRLTLHRIQEMTDPARDAADVDNLKQILLNRIAVLEAAERSNLPLPKAPTATRSKQP